MGETEEEKKTGTTPVKTPQEQIQELQKQQQQVTQEYVDTIDATNTEYQQGYQQRTEELSQAVTTANETAKQAGVSYADMVQSWIDAAKAEADEQRKRNEAQEKSDNRVRMWGGIAEAASALVNIIGTTKGAVSQKWDSPQVKWAERADNLRREREEKLDDYRSQMKTLQQQKAQLMYNLGKEDADRQMQAATMTANRGDQAAQQKYQGDMAAAQAKAQGAQQGAALGMQGLNMLLNQQNQEEGRRIQWASLAQQKENNQRLMEQNEFTQRSYGYDPDTKKWWNPVTKAYDLDAPSNIRGNNVRKGSDVDNSIREIVRMDSSVMDELVSQMVDNDGNPYFGTYSDFTSAADTSRRTREKAIKSKSDVYKLIRKFEDPSGNLKFTTADINLLKQYAPDFHARYGEAFIGATSTDPSLPEGVVIGEDGFPVRKVSE